MIKLFQECRKNFAILGINSNQRTRFNVKVLITYSVYGLALIACAAFFLFKANSFQEYSNNAYIVTASIICLSVYTNLVFQTDSLFKYINNLEQFMEKSEWISSMIENCLTDHKLVSIKRKLQSHSLESQNPASKSRYEKVNQLLEKYSAIGFFVMAKVTPVCWIFPKAIICYCIYFMTDSGNTAFELPMFFWWILFF